MSNYTSANSGKPVTTPGYYLANDATEIVDQYPNTTTALAAREYPGDHVIEIHTDGSWTEVND